MLITLPLLGRPGIGNHVIGGCLVVDVGLLLMSTQRVDTRAEREGQSGNADPFAGVVLLKVAPNGFDPQRVIPAIQAEVTLQLKG
jgi:hypothetical protein